MSTHVVTVYFGQPGAHAGFDLNGNLYLANAAGHNTIFLSPTANLIEFFPSGTGSGAPAIAIASVADTDLFGNTSPAGISLAQLPILTYSGTPAANNLIVSIAPASGTDTFGNAFAEGVEVQGAGTIQVTGSSGAMLTMEIVSGLPKLIIKTGASEEVSPTSIFNEITTPGTDEILNTFIAGPDVTGFTDSAQVVLSSSAKSGIFTAGGQLIYNTRSGQQNIVLGWGPLGVTVESPNSGDTNNYQVERVTVSMLNNAAITINTTGFTQQILQTLALGVGLYHIHGQVLLTPNQAAGNEKLEFGGGTAVASMAIIFKEYAIPNGPGGGSGALANGNVATINAFAQAFSGATFGTADRLVEFDGIINVTTAGSLGLFAATTAVADTYKVYGIGSYMELNPIGPA